MAPSRRAAPDGRGQAGAGLEGKAEGPRSGTTSNGQIFTHEELRTYFDTTTRVGAVAHVSTEEQYQTMRDAGALDDDVVTGATDAILFERARALLLG